MRGCRWCWTMMACWGVGVGLVGLTGCQTPPPPEPEFGQVVGEGTVTVEFSGVTAMLRAAPAAGWHFERWAGPHDTSTENPHTVGRTRVPFYTAYFTENQEDGEDTSAGPANDAAGADASTSGLDATTSGFSLTPAEV